MRHFAWIAAAAAVDRFSVMFRSPTALAIVLMTLEADETKWGGEHKHLEHYLFRSHGLYCITALSNACCYLSTSITSALVFRLSVNRV